MMPRLLSPPSLTAACFAPLPHALPLFSPSTPLFVSGLYWSRVYERNRGAREGVALLFNRQRFALLHHSSIRFGDHTPQPATQQQGGQ